MANGPLYNALAALLAMVEAQWATQVTRLGVTLTAPASGDYLIINPKYDRARHKRFPFVFLIPWPEGQPTEGEYETTYPQRVRRIPIALEVVFRDITGVEDTTTKRLCDYADVIDAVLVVNQNNIGTGRLMIDPQPSYPMYTEKQALWAVSQRATLELDTDYLN